MLGKLAVFLQSKLAVVAVGAALVTGGGTAVVAMATTPTQLPSVAAASQSSLTPSSTQASPVATASSSMESTSTTKASTQAEIKGTVVSVDPTTLSFTMTLKDGSTVTVVTTAQTVFHVDTGSLTGIAAGYTVELKGATQPDGSIVASVIDAAQKPDAHATEGKDGTSTSTDSGDKSKSSSSDSASSGKDGASPTATPTSGDGSKSGGDD